MKNFSAQKISKWSPSRSKKRLIWVFYLNVFLFIFEYNCQNKISHVNTNPSHRLNASRVGSTNPLYISFQKAQCDPKLLWKTTETNKPFSWFQVLFFFQGSYLSDNWAHFFLFFLIFFFFFSYTFGYFPSPSIVKPTKTWVNLSPSEKKKLFPPALHYFDVTGGIVNYSQTRF